MVNVWSMPLQVLQEDLCPPSSDALLHWITSLILCTPDRSRSSVLSCPSAGSMTLGKSCVYCSIAVLRCVTAGRRLCCTAFCRRRPGAGHREPSTNCPSPFLEPHEVQCTLRGPWCQEHVHCGSELDRISSNAWALRDASDAFARHQQSSAHRCGSCSKHQATAALCMLLA